MHIVRMHIVRMVILKMIYYTVGRGNSLVESTPIIRRVVGSNPALATT